MSDSNLRSNYSESYVTLCCELNLDRGEVVGTRVEGWKDGDWVWLNGRVTLYSVADESEWTRRQYGEWANAVWIPTLTDWLYQLGAALGTRDPAYILTQLADVVVPSQSYEEAAARLWMEVMDKRLVP